MTPCRRGRIARIVAGVRPIMRRASSPTAWTSFVRSSIATTDGSKTAIPWSRTNTRVFAEPRPVVAATCPWRARSCAFGIREQCDRHLRRFRYPENFSSLSTPPCRRPRSARPDGPLRHLLSSVGLHLLRQPGILARVAAAGGGHEPREVVIPAVRVRLGSLGVGEVAVDEAQVRAVALGRQLDLDRRGSGRNAALVLPAPGEDEPARWIDFDELAARGVAGNDVAVVEPAGLRLEGRLLSHPARCLVRIDQELPDGLRACSDRHLPLDRGGLSGCVHASSAPPSL